jgi:hypothetical protein
MVQIRFVRDYGFKRALTAPPQPRDFQVVRRKKAIPTNSRVQRAARNQVREDRSAPQAGHLPAAGWARTEMLPEDIRTPRNFNTRNMPQPMYGEHLVQNPPIFRV